MPNLPILFCESGLKKWSSGTTRQRSATEPCAHRLDDLELLVVRAEGRPTGVPAPVRREGRGGVAAPALRRLHEVVPRVRSQILAMSLCTAALILFMPDLLSLSEPPFLKRQTMRPNPSRAAPPAACGSAPACWSLRSRGSRCTWARRHANVILLRPCLFYTEKISLLKYTGWCVKRMTPTCSCSTASCTKGRARAGTRRSSAVYFC
jgi:hypothetical protein